MQSPRRSFDRDPVVGGHRTEGTHRCWRRQIKNNNSRKCLEPGFKVIFALPCRPVADQSILCAPWSTRTGAICAFGSLNDSPPLGDVHQPGAEREASQAIKSAIETGPNSEQRKGGSVSPCRRQEPGVQGSDHPALVWQRLQEADESIMPSLLDPKSSSWRDAMPSVFTLEGRHSGCHSLAAGKKSRRPWWMSAKRGQRVVRLNAGDPGVFGRQHRRN